MTIRMPKCTDKTKAVLYPHRTTKTNRKWNTFNYAVMLLMLIENVKMTLLMQMVGLMLMTCMCHS